MELISDKATSAFKENNFSLEPALSPITGKEENKKLESTHYVNYKGISFLQIQENDDGTFNTFEHLQYPTSFKKVNFNISLDESIRIAQSAVENNHVFDSEVQLTLF
jgi:hypothetical protein